MHTIVTEAEALLDKNFPVLDKGFVRLIDYMGGDDRVVQAARVSYGAGTKTYRQDKGLIHYLIRNWHTSPFEQVQLTFHAKMPIFVARQWVRHRTARLNEVSGRYSKMKDQFYLPQPEQVRLQSKDNKQGRSDECVAHDVAVTIIQEMDTVQRELYEDYENLINQNVARELARTNLPLSLYTEWYWQIDLHNLFHFLLLRTDPHAQEELRAYAEVIATCAKAVAPLSYEAFEEHWLKAVSFSATEQAELAHRLNGQDSLLTCKELDIFEKKLAKVMAMNNTTISQENFDDPTQT